ncbi:uncharacterized protein LOC141641940 [Silene latifolia]|uniref:uncharacterized protein LOC141641940 n=1 Tax=Silene latifolia TaxID=37657 RepID=UPI003D7854C3
MAEAIEKIRQNTPYLPDEVIFKILIFVPVKELHEAMRYVCKQWYDIVSDPFFARARFRVSTPGFLLQESNNLHQLNYIEAYNSPTPKTLELQIPYPTKILCCLNGLVLLSYSPYIGEIEIFQVINPLTKAKISLPYSFVGLGPYSSSTAGLAVDSTGHYVVVHVCGENFHVRVFTIGVDKFWRLLDFQGVPVKRASDGSMKFDRPHCFGRFIYWFNNYPYINSIGLALDVDTETIYLFSVPKGKVKYSSLLTVVPMETSIGLVDESSILWRAWKLTDVKSNKWTQLARINVQPVISWVDKMFYRRNFKPTILPVSLSKGEIWFYCRVDELNIVVRYNLTNKSLEFFVLSSVSYIHPHVNTLVSPMNC